MKMLCALCALFGCLSASVRGQAFSDDFTRPADPGDLAPWSAQAGNWTVTGGAMKGGVNPLSSYAFATITNSWVNYSVQARIRFPVGAYGGGPGGRLNVSTGSHYAAWVYPENSPGGSSILKLIKFLSYGTFAYTNTIQPMAVVNLPSVGTNFHTVKLVFTGNLITVLYDTNQVIAMSDADPQPYSSGGVSLDMWTDSSGYLLTVDDVLVTTSPPIANNDSYSVTSGTTLNVAAPGVLGNDTGGNGILSVVRIAAPLHGNHTLNADGSFTYTPTNNYTGADSFTYFATDGQTNSPAATVTLTVTPDHPPVANADNYTVLMNTVLTVNAPGVLSNDSDVDGNPITAALVANATNGTVTLNTNGGFTYRPNTGFSGVDVFTYRANDGPSNSATTAVTISVLSLTPLFTDDFTRGTDPGPLAPWNAQSGNWTVTGGTLKDGTNTLFSYGFAYVTNIFTNYSVQARVQFPAGAYGGGLGAMVDPLTGSHYAAWIYPEDSPGGSLVLKLFKFQNWLNFSYLGVAAPMAQASLPAVGTNFHTLKLGAQGNRIAVYFDGALLISTTDAEAQPYTSGAVAAGMWTDSTGYRMSIDDLVVASLVNNDSFSVNEDAILTVAAPGVLGNDSAVDGFPLTATLLSDATNGTVTLNANGGFTYIPDLHYFGPDSFSYRVDDGASTLGTATANITVRFVNHPPVLTPQTNRTIVETTTLIVTNTATDVESPTESLVYQLLSPPTGAGITNGVIFWTPSEAQGPGTYTLTTRVTDNGVPPASSTNSFTVSVTESNLVPVLSPQSDVTVQELVLMTVTNRATDADLPANTLTYSLLAPPVGAGITNGVIFWTPSEAQGPGSYLITTRVVDNGVPPLSATNSFTATVLDINSVPIFPLQSNRTIAVLTQLTVTNTAKDTDIPTNNLSYLFLEAPSNAVISANGIITWTPTLEQDQTTNLFQTVVTDDGTPPLSATNSFVVFVNENPVMIVNGATLAQEGCTGTNNAIDPGERVTVLFAMKNLGTGNTTNLVVTLLETNGVALPNGPQSYGVVTAGGAAVSQAFTFAATGACGGSISPTFQLQDGGANLGTATTSLPLGGLVNVFTQNFDSVTAPALPAGWTTSSSGAQTNWVTVTTQVDTAPNAVFSADGTNVGVNELVSPVFTLPQGPSKLSFRHRYALETGVGTNGFDGGVLEIKIGDGAFLDISNAGGIFLSGGYASRIDTRYSNSLSGRWAWSGTITSYTNTVVALPIAAAGQPIQFRWLCGTDNGGNSLAGWRIDTIGVTGIACCANTAPVLADQADRTIAELTTLVVTNTGTDSPANVLSYSLLNPPSGAQINSNGIITWTPDEAQGPGVYTLTTVVADNAYPPLTATNSFNVTVTEVNSAPSLPVQFDRTITEGTTLVVTNTAADSDLPPNGLTYTLLTAPINAVIDANGIITWTPGPGETPGTNVFTTRVTDDGVPTFSDTNTFRVFVTVASNTPPPVIQSIAVSNNVATLTWTAVAGRQYRVQFKADLVATNWVSVLPDITASGPSAQATDPVNGSTQRFYRVMLVP